MSTSRAFAVVTGGGTAGHVLPALAVAEGLVAAGHEPADIHYIGARRGIETTLAAESPFPHRFLDVVGFQRRVSRQNLAFVPKMVRATREARAILRELRPHVVVSVGGYASMPAVFAARTLRIPIVVVSYDRRPGRASQLSAMFAAAAAAAFDDTSLPRAEVTGAPVRRAVLEVDRVGGRAAARRALGVPEDRFLLAVTGGSLGSGALNDAIGEWIEAHGDDRRLAVRHVVGDRFLEQMGPSRSGNDGMQYDVVGFDRDLPTTYAAADLLVGRGGASTVAEVATTGIPAILVPWSGAADDHQTENVRWLAAGDAAVMLADADVGQLGAHLDSLRADPQRRADIGRNARAMGEIHRSGALPALIERVADCNQ